MCGSASLWGVVVAAGSGERYGDRKQFVALAGRLVVERACDVFPSDAVIGVVVALPSDPPLLRLPGHAVTVTGGATRRASVRAALGRIPRTADLVAVHDAARPLATPALLFRLLAALHADPGAAGAVPVVPVTDALKRREGSALRSVDRSPLVITQTPQLFRADLLRRAHAEAPEGMPGFDDAEVVEAIGGRVLAVDGDLDNRKLTHPGDLSWLAASCL